MKYQAPGRVNLIGEHTDYNLGFVLPIALDLITEAYWGYVHKQRSSLILSSESYKEHGIFAVSEIPTLKPKQQWTDYVVGVAQQLLKLGIQIKPTIVQFKSTVPEGAGLSSSAALEVCSALTLSNIKIDPLELAKLCQRAEREFVGVPSGIMDQYVSVFGRKDHAVLIDCRSLSHQYVPIPANVEIWAVNSMVKHALGSSAYKDRVAECSNAAAALGVASLRDATVPKLETTPMPPLIHRRARHVITENIRVQSFVRAAEAGNLASMGQLFYESHVSMQHDYEISCEEIDFLVQIAMGHEGCYGSRMTGGGFGGCTVNLLRPGAVEHFQQVVTDAYRERFNLTPQFIKCNPSDGAMVLLDANRDEIPQPMASSDDPHRD